MNTIKETLEFLIKSIVPETEEIKIEANDTEAGTILSISAPQETVGKIIGKEGRIIKSIRTILNIAYPNTRFTLDIKD